MTTTTPKTTAPRAPNPDARPAQSGETAMQAGEAAATAGKNPTTTKAG